VPDHPIAYFITFTTYGVWLHGRATGSVDHRNSDYGSEFIPANPKWELLDRTQMKEEPYLLDSARRKVVLETICEVAKFRGWKLWAVQVRTNHVHIVVSGEATPEKIMSDFKAYSSRRLKERLGEIGITKRWTQHGSTKYMWNEESMRECIDYALNGQGTRMEHFDGSLDERGNAGG